MRKQRICFIFLFFGCLLMPFVAMADFSLNLSSEEPWIITPLESITFTVEVQEDGSPVSGQSVTFSVSPDDGIASLSSTSATTDSNGQAQTTLSLSGDSSEGHYTVTAKLDNGEGNVPSESIPVGTVSDGAELILYVDLRPYSPGESVAFTFSLRKEDGSGVSGRTVTFSVSPNNGTASLSTTSATTDSNGGARTTLVLGSNASGRYSVTATLDDGKSVSNGIGSVHNPNKPSGFIFRMLVRSGALPLNPGGSRTFIAIVEKNGYVSGRTVTFSVSPNDGTVSLSPTTATTGSDGQASTSLITGSGSSGAYTVTATLDNGQSISGTVTVEGSSSPPPTDPNPDPPPEVIQIPQEQQAAAQSSTGNTQRTPHSGTTNTPADTTPTPDTPKQPTSDLVVDAFKVNKDVLDAGESFTISAVVKNQGEESSSTGTLTYYQYFDDKSVEKVGESDIASLAAGETTDVSITLTAPETSGTHSYYACISTHCTSIVNISVRSGIKELVIASGDNQTGTPNSDLPNPISVQVLGEDGRGVPRVLVIFRVVSGTVHMRRAGGPKRWGGTSAWTDSEGYAKAYVTPADTETIKIRASLRGSVDDLDPVVFTVNPEQAGGAPSAQFPQSNVTALLANYPNPFNPETWIPYRLAKASEVVVAIFASNGQVVRRLHLGHQPAGIYQSRSRAAHWDGKNEYGEPVASGLYFYTLTAGDFTATRKMLIKK